ncbi:MAG: cholesterol 25-hydroxylase-like [Lasallia pustulata]|uniref:Cholesterol 25-hydroxylase-like n=1 Tax=Lasallia pustulata TaxID=136370 RepID=A0A5M8PVE8_9LECA|nr:MAG: cholesterol 25-hydroxylase-like [Lasallia pustulata]
MSSTTTAARPMSLSIASTQRNRKLSRLSLQRADRYISRNSVIVPRLVIGALVLTGVLFPSLYHHSISSLYSHLYKSRFYNLSTFETIETFLVYAILEPLYTVKFTRNPGLRLDVRGSNPNGLRDISENPKWPRMRRPSRRLREMATFAAPLLLMDLAMIKKFAGVPLTDIRRSGGYTAVPSHSERISASFLAPTIHNLSLSSPLQLVRALPVEPPSSRRIMLELIVSFFIYDMLFFFIHLAFHRLSLLRQFHQPHHKHAEINPQVTNQLSVVERMSLILLANFSLNIIGSHVLTRTMFVPIFVYLLIEIHCGLDLEWGYDKILPNGWGAGSRKHAVHHREGEGSYEPYFCWWDRGLSLLESPAEAMWS